MGHLLCSFQPMFPVPKGLFSSLPLAISTQVGCFAPEAFLQVSEAQVSLYAG